MKKLTAIFVTTAFLLNAMAPTLLIGATTKSDKWVKVSPQSLNLSVVPISTKGLRAARTFNF